MQLNIGLYTVILLAGPSQCGKSTWANNFKQKISNIDNNMHTAIISSDSIRQRLLGQEYHRYDKKMLEVSEAAFDLLFEELKASIRFPVNNHFVIIDTTGLDADFRFKITTLAKEHNYRTAIVMFDYPTGEYFKGLSGSDKLIVSKHVDTFKKKVLPTIKRKHFDYSFSVKSKDAKFYDEMIVNVEDYKVWKKCNLFSTNVKKKPIAIIGDIHEHIVALENLISTLPEGVQLVFVGDLFDKGNQTKEMVGIAEKLLEDGAMIVRGNHESFVARRLKGEVEAISNENELFPSLAVFQADNELAQRFLKIYEQTLPFLCIHSHEKTVYVTHAPCYNKMLGKLDERSQKFQRNFYFTSREPEQMEKDLSFINEEAKFSHPLHVFGHVAHNLRSIINKNKYWLDTGAVYGNSLSALIIYPNGENKLITQKTTPLTTGNLFGNKAINNNAYEEPEASIKQAEKAKDNIEASVINQNTDILDVLVNKYKLNPEDKYWLKSFEESGAKFISGTMSPARSTREKLEPIDTALQYFKSKNIKDVIIEPKYMGSRLQVYLHRDPTKDFAITRSGNRAGNQQMLKEIFNIWHEKLDKENFWKESIVLDGELLPWSAIGKDLIEKEFVQYGKSIEKEWELLSSDANFNKFATQIGIDIPLEKKGIETFMKQVDMYGSEHPVEYKPFSILTVDNILWIEHNQEEIFTWLLPNDKYKVIHLEDKDSLEKANAFFIELTSDLNNKEFAHEGVVVKPIIFEPGIAPYMKVRNENYLHIIYGYDYLKKYQEKVSNKKVNRKLELSVKEYDIGIKMLTSKTKEELLELACQMKFEINQEKELDSRL